MAGILRAISSEMRKRKLLKEVENHKKSLANLLLQKRPHADGKWQKRAFRIADEQQEEYAKYAHALEYVLENFLAHARRELGGMSNIPQLQKAVSKAIGRTEKTISYIIKEILSPLQHILGEQRMALKEGDEEKYRRLLHEEIEIHKRAREAYTQSSFKDIVDIADMDSRWNSDHVKKESVLVFTSAIIATICTYSFDQSVDFASYLDTLERTMVDLSIGAAVYKLVYSTLDQFGLL